MNILVIDAQGGGAGKQLVTSLKQAFPSVIITAVGTNCAATSAMLKAGCDHAATGENAVITCCRKADIIIGPLGIVIADSLYGEITPRIALAVARSTAKKILIPFSNCDNIIVGVSNLSIAELVSSAINEVKKTIEQACQEGR